MTSSDPTSIGFEREKADIEGRWGRWGLNYPDVMSYYGREAADLVDEHEPLPEEIVFTNEDLLRRALQPGHRDAEAIRTWKEYVGNVPVVARDLLKDHVEKKDSRISYLPDDPEAYPGQGAMRFWIPGNRQPRKNTDGLAQSAEPRWPGLIEEMKADRESMASIESGIRILQDGKSLWALTFHAEDIIDTIFAQKLVLDLFDEQGYEPDMTITSISKAIAWGQYDLGSLGKAPMLPVVQTAADRVHLPWPNTKSSQQALEMLPPSEVNSYNKRIADDTNALLRQGKVFGTLSPRARTRAETDDPGVFIGSGVNEGTAKFMVHPDVYVMPVSLWRMSSKLVARCLQPVKLRHIAQVDPLMQWFAYDLSDLVTDKTFIYDPSRAD